MKVALYLISATVILVILAQLVLARVELPATEQSVEWYYTVQHDDTLWAIARKYYPRKDPRMITWDIRVLNDLTSATIHPGQRLKMPKGSNRVEVED